MSLTTPTDLHYSLAGILSNAARRWPNSDALSDALESLTYSELQRRVHDAAADLSTHGILAGERIGIFVPKTVDAVVATFAIALAGGIFIPINPVLKASQLKHILEDSGAVALITDHRLSQQGGFTDPAFKPICPTFIMCEHRLTPLKPEAGKRAHPSTVKHTQRPDTSARAILYTSGSSGPAKGVILSDKNLVCGANSVNAYLKNKPSDKILAVLPLSFDAGLSQLTTAFSVGASVHLFDFLLPQDLVRTVDKYRITAVTAVPTLWNSVAGADWSLTAQRSIRYIANTGGAMPEATLRKLQQALPKTEIFLMYGLTEAFRSTYLAPEHLNSRPNSVGHAIPGADVSVRRPDGSRCGTGEIGELVHRGPTVAKGYWNRPEQTAARFRPITSIGAKETQERVVWTGDMAYTDSEDFIYFVERSDEMIKTAGFRVSPTEIESIVTEHPSVKQCAAIGVPDKLLGQAIVLYVLLDLSPAESPVLRPRTSKALDDIRSSLQEALPHFMQPRHVIAIENMPLSPNAKIDRAALKLLPIKQDGRDIIR